LTIALSFVGLEQLVFALDYRNLGYELDGKGIYMGKNLLLIYA